MLWEPFIKTGTVPEKIKSTKLKHGEYVSVYKDY
jgi:hypothetical protein